MKEPGSPDAARTRLSELLMPEVWLSIESKYHKRQRQVQSRSRLLKTLAVVLVLCIYSPYMKDADKTFFPATKPLVSQCLPNETTNLDLKPCKKVRVRVALYSNPETACYLLAMRSIPC